ncbi:MAG: hypothetical protein Q4G00_13855, partial [Clostridia bacterium]|nr:hypothetical protein [Clostridia bacterium]
PPTNFARRGSRAVTALAQDEPSIPASGRNRIGGEISRNEQSPLWGVATIEAAELGARSPQRNPLFGLQFAFYP